jgi:uncharacterized protein involved in exopolysaccharide biosynthesis
MNDQKYPVYDYVKFIWDKKLLLILATILFMIAGAVFSFTRTQNYTSTALVFTGTGNNEFLSKPDLIESKYKEDLPENLRNTLNVKIKEPYQIELSLAGTDKNTVESVVTELADKYVGDLTDRYKLQYGLLREHTKALKAKVEEVQQSLETYEELSTKEGNENLNYTDIGILIKRYEALPRFEEDLTEAEYELALMEEPDLAKVTTNASSNNLLRNVFLGAALGFQLMLVILVFWKYVLNARRSESQK